MHNTHYLVYKEMYNDLTPLVMLKRTKKFTDLKNKLLANLTDNSFKLGREQKKGISRDIVNYLTIKAYMVSLSKDKYAGKTLQSLQNSLIYDGNIYKGIDKNALSIKDVLDSIKMKLDKSGKKNMFIDDFTRYTGAEHEDNKSGTMKLESNTWMQFSDSELTRVQNSVLELLMLDEGGGEMYDDVMHLVHYLAVTRGMAFGDGSFINVIPTVLVKDLLNSVDKVHELFLDTKEREGAYNSVFGMSSDEIVTELIMGYTKSKAAGFFLQEVSDVDIIEEQNVEPIDNIGEELDTLTIDYTRRESDTNSQMLSNEAYRPFSHRGKEFGTVMHAYNVWKTGVYDEATDKKYRKGDNKDQLLNAVGKTIEGKKKKIAGAKSNDYLLAELVEESILTKPNLENKDGSLLGQILISSKEFTFPNNSWMSKATKKGLLNARENLVYVELTKEQKADALTTRKFKDSRKVSDKAIKNKNIFSKSPGFVNVEEKTFTIDIFRGIPAEFQDNRVKGIRKLKGKGVNQENRSIKQQHVESLMKSGFRVRNVDIKNTKNETVPIAQIEFPAVISPIPGKYYALKTVFRDTDYKKEGDIVNLIPSDNDVAYGNKAEYEEIELEGSSTQTKIAFLFGNRPTHNEIVEYGKDKSAAMGEIVAVEQEQDVDEVRERMGLGAAETQTTDESAEMYDEHSGDDYGSEEMNEGVQNNNPALKLTEEELLIDFYDGLTAEQKTKLATDEDLKITSAKNVVSLLKKEATASQIMELLKKCYI